MEKREGRLYGLDILRILSMILITIIHFIAYSLIMFDENITTTNHNNFGVLFHGSGINDEFSVVAYPYITYIKDGNTITYYGTTIVNTLSFTAE